MSDNQTHMDTQTMPYPLTDIYSRQFNPYLYDSDRLFIYTAASKATFQSLTNLMKKIDEKVKSKYPLLKMSFINIADLKVVPKSLRPNITTLLKKIDSNNTTSSINHFSKQHPNIFNPQDMFFIADWDGEIINDLFDKDSKDSKDSYKIKICINDQTIITFDNCSEIGSKENCQYMNTIDNIVKDFPNLIKDDNDSNEIRFSKEIILNKKEKKTKI